MNRRVPGEMAPDHDRMGRSALHYAALNADVAEVNRLITAGGAVSAPDKNGFTPLHFATQSNSLPVSEILLAAGAAVDAEDANGNTPLSNAVFYSRGERALIARLLRAGADPHRANRHGMSPIGLARTMADPRLITYFEDADAR